MLDSILSVLPNSLKRIVGGLPQTILEQLEEIRIRERRPLEIACRDGYSFVAANSGTSSDPSQAYMPSREDCLSLLELLTGHSVYSFDEQLKRGYITIKGGHRVGLAGRTVLEGGRVKLIKDVSGFNIRVARQVAGIGKRVLPFLLDPGAKSVRNTLIVSLPQQGKTTLLRDVLRLVSAGEWPAEAQRFGFRGKGLKVGIVDERSELAASEYGVPTFDLGPRTDVLDGCPKAEGMMMMIRSMSPEVIGVDEIGRPEDAEAIREAIRAGVRVVATAHGRNLDEIRDRPILRELVGEGVFERYVLLSGKYGAGTVEAIFGASGERLKETAAGAAEGGGV